MADLVVCQFGLLNINGKESYRPIIALYSKDWASVADVIQPDGTPLHNWCIARVDIWQDLAAAQADTRVTIVPKKTLTGGFTGGERTAINNKLTEFGVVTRVIPSDTMSTLMLKLGAELNQSIGFDPANYVK